MYTVITKKKKKYKGVHKREKRRGEKNREAVYLVIYPTKKYYYL